MNPMTERERRAFNRGLEHAAKIADIYADENWRMCHDSILHDPVLQAHNKGGLRTLTKEALAKSDKCQIDGTVHSSMAHASQNIAGAIRKAKIGSAP